MDHITGDIARIGLIGVGATAFMDAWLLGLKRLKVPTLDFALLGRWLGHLGRGRWKHVAISRAAPIRGESAWGWLLHYATGIAFAALLVGITGTAWTHAPTLLPALAVGAATVVVPLFVLQPALGAGIASWKTPNPLLSCVRSLMNHTVFGAGLYVSAAAIERLAR
jgi:hypothetical protein